MILALKQGGTSDTTNPVLVFVYIEPQVGERAVDDSGFIEDVESLTYRVLFPDGTEHTALTAVDLVNDRVRVGTYAPSIAIDGADPVGEYTIEWAAIREVGVDPTITWTTKFTVVPSSETIPDGYVLLSEMRQQGVPQGFCDADVVAAVERASRYVEEITRRFFEPRYLKFQRDGSGNGYLLQLDDPIIGLEDLEITFSDFAPAPRLIDRAQVRVYNRHIRPSQWGRLLSPDDRDNPKVAILRVEDTLSWEPRFPPLSRRFPSAQQNVQFTGWFGYTDPDGSPFGKTPELLKRIVMMLAMRDLRPLWKDFGGGRRGGGGGVLKSEKTRDQAVAYETGKSAGVAGIGWITGDAEIDNLLSHFIGPTKMAAV